VGFDWNSFFWARKGIPRVGSSARGPGERRSVILSFERETARAFPFFPAFGPGGEAGYLYLSAPFTVQRLSVASGKAERPLYAIPPPGAGEQGKSAPLNFQERSESPVYAATLAVFSPPVPPEGAVASSPAGAVPGVPAEGAGAPSPLPPAASRQPPASGEAASPAGTAILVTSYVSDLVPFRHYMGYEITADIPTRSLVAFDADTGKPLWWTSDLSLGGERKPVSFTTPALLRGGRVFAGGWQPHGYLDGVLVALDQNDGRVLWHQLVASSQMEGTMFGELAREPFASLLAEREGVLYYSTNLGAIAALSAGTGRILWMTTYDSIPVKPADGRRSEFRRIVWGANPLLFVGETLIVTPRDSLHLYAIDCSTVPSSNSSAPDPVRGAGAGSRGRQGGRILWSYSNAAGDLRDLLGYAEGRLYFTGPGGVQALDISETPLKAPRKIPGPIPRSDEGRGALTDSGVVLVARVGGPRPEIGQRPEGESRLWLVDFSLKNRIDLSGPLPPPDSLTYGGNVTVKDGRIFLTSRDLVAAYSPRPELGDVPGEARPPLTGKSSEPPLEKSEEEEHP
jgi:outer membrane protein assembly factor BamB